MTKQQKTLWQMYCDGVSLDAIWTLAEYRTRDAALKDLRQLRFDHWRRTGEKIDKGA